MLVGCCLLGVQRLSAQSYAFTSVAGVYSATGVAVDADGNIYAAGYYSNAIWKITPPATAATLLAGGSFGSADGTGTAARFNNPRALAVDAAGNLYVADTSNHTIRKITPAGQVTTLAGLAGTRGWDDGTGADARFDSPQGVAVDRSGNVYVADTGSRTVRKITPAGVVTTLAGLGYVTAFTDGTGLAARFETLQGIAVDANGVVYVADTGNHAIRRISPAGVTTTIAASGGNRGYVDGVGPNARFDNPQAIAVDATGTLFVADTNNFTIRRITADGVVATIGGTPGIAGDALGLGAAARFYSVRGLFARPNGTLYLADSYSLKLATPSNQLAITLQPASQSIASGSATDLSVTATGGAPISYQWQKDGVAIPGATRSTLPLTNVQASATGSYTVVVTNPVATLTSSTAAITVLSPLANDNFANAQVITGSTGRVTGLNNGATGEPGEPTHAAPAATASSVWYRWTPAESGTAIFDCGGTTTLGMAVYTGTALDKLTRVAQGTGSRVVFHAISGTTYLIAVGSSSASSFGTFSATWRILLNDNFEEAETIAGRNGAVNGTNNGATGQAGEPNHSPGSTATSSSVWYRWTPTDSGLASFRAVIGNTPLVVAVYTGNSLSSLVRATPSSTNSAGTTYVPVVAGTTYAIAVGSSAYNFGNFMLEWSTTVQPVILNQSGGGSYLAGATVTFSVGSISHLPVTYQWFKDNVAIPGATNSSYVIGSVQTTDAGAYSVRVANAIGAALSTAFAPLAVMLPPPNDNFASAQPIFGLTGSISGTNVNASGEPGEPPHWNASGSATSVWYRWVAPTTGLAVIDTVGSAFDTVLAIYTGDALTSLTRLVQDDDRGGGRTSQVSFAATGGTTYSIAIGGNSPGARGALTLGWQLSPAVAITAAPLGQTVAVGGSATFSVQASGTGLTYQWNRNGTPIPGATRATLTIGSVEAGSDASYTVTVSNGTTTVISSAATLAVAAPTATALSVRRARAEGDLLWSIAGGAGQLVTVGSYGVILSSNDNGATWVPRESGTNGWLVAVTYGGDQFVIVGEAGTILTSPDGRTWTRATYSGTTERLNGIVYADGKYVAVGEHGAAVTSVDGRVWTPRSTPVNTWLHGLAYHAGIRQFATVGENAVVLISPDGITWTRLPVTGFSKAFQQIVAVDSYAHFVAVGEDGMVVSIRQNAFVDKLGQPFTTWTTDLYPTGSNTHYIGLAQGAGALFAMGYDGKVITATSDRGPWTLVPSGTGKLLLAGMFYNDTLYAVGENETVLQSSRLFSSRLINISTRGQVGTGANIMISGFVVTGDTPKQVLVRAAGPTLASAFGLTGTLAAPVLTLVDAQSRTIAINSAWGTAANPAAIAATAARVGAFPFASGSADSAVLTTLAPGNYTALISGTNNATGLSIVEVYDADALSNQGSRAINISTRGVAGGGANKMIAGFVIDGASSRRVLIRAVGPTLGNAPFNLTGTLAEPQLELYNGRNLLHSSAGAWGLQPNADEIRGSAKSVGAFELPEGSKDAAMVVTLPPGAWTVQVGGVGTGTGVVLVEVYAVP